MNLSSDSTLGPYRIVRPLGRGGMGVVYEAEHVGLGVHRAVKVFTRVDDEGLRRRFLAEGRLLARLVHPRLVRVHDLGVDDATGLVWFAMDLVLDGTGSPRTLEDVRRAGDISEEQAARWFSDLREALAYVHEVGVTHRDVKLENVLVDAEGHAVLSDFGVSRILDPDLRTAAGFSATATYVGASLQRPVLGTLGYLSPEVKAGFAATPADLTTWKKWNEAMRKLYPAAQIVCPETVADAEGRPRQIGYWQNKDTYHDPVMGTCLCALQLMVYYRYLPTTSLHAAEPLPDVSALAKDRKDEIVPVIDI